MDWITNVENFLDYIDTAPERRVKVVACQLRVQPLLGGIDYNLRGSDKVRDQFKLSTV